MTSLEINITAGGREFVRWLVEDAAYEDTNGATLYSGAAEPSALDLADCIQNPRTPPAPPAPPHRILKDTIIQRVKAADKLAELRVMIAGLDSDALFEWNNSSWFHSNNPLLLNGVLVLGLNPSAVLAADPLAP